MNKLLLLLAVSILTISCSEKTKKEISAEKTVKEVSVAPSSEPEFQSVTEKNNVTYIESDSHFEEVISRSDSVLLIFDLYADWCKPCKILSPILEEISGETEGKAEIYKINVDKLPNISRAFGVKSIPLVVFIKNKKGVNGLVGVQPKKAYIDAINKFAF